jgi:hypothetical protein
MHPRVGNPEQARYVFADNPTPLDGDRLVGNTIFVKIAYCSIIISLDFSGLERGGLKGILVVY